jgi:hypothetical protein
MLSASLTLALGLLTAAPTAKPTPLTSASQVLPFVADDLARALAEARAKNRPLFVEAWASW